MKSSTGSAPLRRRKAENRRRSAEARQKRGDRVRVWRKAAGASIVVTLLILALYFLGGARSARPIPEREDLVRIEGTVDAMRIRRSEDNDCLVLSVRIDRGPLAPPPRRIRAWNDVVCGALEGVAPLPRGAPVTVLVQRMVKENVVWEMTSGGRRLVAYERMRAARKHQQRVYRFGRTLAFVLCVPFALIAAVYVCMEVRHRLISVADRG